MLLKCMRTVIMALRLSMGYVQTHQIQYTTCYVDTILCVFRVLVLILLAQLRLLNYLKIVPKIDTQIYMDVSYYTYKLQVLSLSTHMQMMIHV